MSTETMPQVKPIVNATNSLENLSVADTAQILCENWGFSVFPLASREKVPAPFIPSWKNYQIEPASFEMVENWWEHHPLCNIAIITGKISNLVVVDADNENAIEWVQENFIKTTVKVKTHRGFHYFYKYPHGQEAWLKAERERHKKLKDGIDIQIDGCYVVGPNSTHPDGDTYTMFEEFPGAWTDDLVPELQFATDIPEITDTDVNIDLSDVPDYFSELKQGGRHDAILSYVGALIAKGLPYHEVLQKAREEVANRCEQTVRDPFTDKEIVSIVRSTFKTHERNHPETATTVNGGEPAGGQEYVLPECLEPPINRFPLQIQKLLREIVEIIGCPTQIAVAALLGLVSMCVGQTRAIHLKKGFSVVPNLFLILVGLSGIGKSPVSKIFLRCVREKEQELYQKWLDEKVQYEKDLAEFAQLSKKKDADFLSITKPTPPIRRQIFIEKTTIEAVEDALSENPRGVTIVSDEFSGFLSGRGRHTNGDSKQFTALLNSAYDQNPYKSSTRTSRNIYVPRPCLSIFGEIQPRVLANCIEGNDFDSGFLPRVSMIRTEQTSPSLWSEAELSEDSENLIKTITEKLLSLDGDIDAYGNVNPTFNYMDMAGKAAFVEWYNHIGTLAFYAKDREKESPFLVKSRIEGAKIIEIVHLLRYCCGEVEINAPIDLDTVKNGLDFTGFLINNTLQISEMIRAVAPGNQNTKEVRNFTREQMAVMQAICSVEEEISRDGGQISNDRLSELISANGFSLNAVKLGLVCTSLDLQKTKSGGGIRGRLVSRQQIDIFKRRVSQPAQPAQPAQNGYSCGFSDENNLPQPATTCPAVASREATHLPPCGRLGQVTGRLEIPKSGSGSGFGQVGQVGQVNGNTITI